MRKNYRTAPIGVLQDHRSATPLSILVCRIFIQQRRITKLNTQWYNFALKKSLPLKSTQGFWIKFLNFELNETRKYMAHVLESYSYSSWLTYNFNYGQVKLNPNFTLTVKFAFVLMVCWQSLSAQTLKFPSFGDSICHRPSKFLPILRTSCIISTNFSFHQTILKYKVWNS